MLSDGKNIYLLAFDHREQFRELMDDVPNSFANESIVISDAKDIVYEALVDARKELGEAGYLGALVDEEYGEANRIPQKIKGDGFLLAMPVEKSAETGLVLEYGSDFGEHIERFDPDFTKALVRFNPEADPSFRADQIATSKSLADWHSQQGRRFLFELIVPPTPEQLASVDGDAERYCDEIRPGLMIEAIRMLQDAGIEPSIWKIEGVRDRTQCEAIAATCRRDGRDDVICVLLGSGASLKTIEDWIKSSANVDGYRGFAIGRSIWYEPITEFVRGALRREEAKTQITSRLMDLISLYEEAR